MDSADTQSRKCCGWALSTNYYNLSIQDVPVLLAFTRIVDTACDLRVVINTGLTMSDHVTASVVRSTTSCVSYE